jgi:hypothetical protein
MIRRKDQAGEDARTVERVTAALEGYLGSGAGSVSVAHVLDLLNPRGLWRFDPERGNAPQEAPKSAPGGDHDAITGCAWAGPPGSAPPGS